MTSAKLQQESDIYKPVFSVNTTIGLAAGLVTISQNYTREEGAETGAPHKIKAVVSCNDKEWVFVSDHNFGMFVPDFFTDKTTRESRNFFSSFTPKTIPTKRSEIEELTGNDNWKGAIGALAILDRDFNRGGDVLMESKTLARATSGALLMGKGR